MNIEKKEEEITHKIIKVEALELLTTKGFMQRYETIAKENDVTFHTAYKMTEAEYEEAFETRRYKHYQNFRNSYSQFIKRKKNKKNESQPKVKNRSRGNQSNPRQT